LFVLFALESTVSGALLLQIGALKPLVRWWVCAHLGIVAIGGIALWWPAVLF
jgi:hypothetical protein